MNKDTQSMASLAGDLLRYKSYLLDTYYGRKLKLRSTGNASGPTNFYWAAGDKTPEQILKSVDKGLLLTGMLGQGTVFSPSPGSPLTACYGNGLRKSLTIPMVRLVVSMDRAPSFSSPTRARMASTVSGTTMDWLWTW